MSNAVAIGPACRLGEGLYVGPESVFWIDILRRQLFRIPSRLPTADGHIAEGRELSVEGTVVLSADGDRVLIAHRDGLAWIDFAGRQSTTVGRFCSSLVPPTHRTNDGTALSAGGWLIGTMHREAPQRDPGRLLYVDGTGVVHDLGIELGIPNTFVETEAGSVLVSDSLSQRIYLITLDTDGGVADRQVWYQHRGEGTPDGGCRLPNGRIAVAIWDEARIAILSPSGKPLESLQLPVQRPTNCKYDRQKSILWITSATTGLRPDRLSSVTHSGYTFALELLPA